MTHYSKFALLFNKYRLHSEFDKLTNFAAALAEEGIIYEDSIFSRWKNGNRLPKNRKVIIAILRVFIKRKAITRLDQANEFLEVVNQRDLTQIEISDLFKYPLAGVEKSVLRESSYHYDSYFAIVKQNSDNPFLKKNNSVMFHD